MSVPICGTWGISKTVSFYPFVTVATLYWEFSFSKAWFSVTCWGSTPVVAFSSMFFCLARALIYYRGSTLSLCYLAPSFSYSWSLVKVVPEFCVYQDLTESLILTFSLLPILLEKLVSCCFLDWKQSKFAWDHIQIAYLAEFLHEIPCMRYSRLRDYFWT